MEKKIKRLIKLCVVILIFILGIIAFIKIKENLNKPKYEVMGVYNKESILKEPSVKYKNLSNLSIIENSNLLRIEIAREFEKIIEERIPIIFSETNSSSDNSIKYYQENKFAIKNMFYQINEEDFVKLVQKIHIMKADLSKEFDTIDFTKSIDEQNAIIKCSYTTGEALVFQLSKMKQLTFVE